ncbi:DNA alkylation repair protein [candidate division KSB1 bacterium]
MNVKDILSELKTLGTEQNVKIYRRHGVGENSFGVSFADLRRLAKRIKTDHAAALELWRSGVHEARMLAAMIADTAAADEALLDSWAADLDNYVLTDEFSKFVAGTSHARQKMEEWTKVGNEWIGRAGWQLLALLAMKDDSLSDSYLEGWLTVIERDIHSGKNRVRDAMNSALIAIGIRNRSLENKAVTAAGRIGVVNVDHGQTSCKTSDAVEYIKRTVRRRDKK